MGSESLAGWAESSGQEMQDGKIIGIEADPEFYGQLNTGITDPYKLNTLRRYMLRPDSPLKNKGIDIRSVSVKDLPVADFFGNPVPRGKATEAGIFEME